MALDADGHVLVAYPFSGRPTGHTVQLGGGPVLHAMCAIDALGIPLMTRLDGVIGSADPDNRQLVHIERHGEEWRWVPADIAVLVCADRWPRLGRGLPVPDGHIPRQRPARRGAPACPGPT